MPKQLNIRMRPDELLRERIALAAKLEGKSMNQVIIGRLQASFDAQDLTELVRRVIREELAGKSAAISAALPVRDYQP